MTAPKLTKAQRARLEHAASRPNGIVIAPRLEATARRLAAEGLLMAKAELFGTSHVVRYFITDAGRAALKDGAK